MPISDSQFFDLQSRVVEVERSVAVSAETARNTERRLTGIEIGVNRLIWMVVGAVIVQILALVINGNGGIPGV
jgi:hypothetical protein